MNPKKQKSDFAVFKDNNVNGAISVGYDHYYPCQNGSNCCDNDYCRCGQIVNHKVDPNANDSYYLARETIKSNKLLLDFRFYCLERYINSLLKKNTDCFDVTVCGGYYGQEVDKVLMDWDIMHRINNFITRLKGKLTVAKKRELVEKILVSEYGYILPSIKGATWEYDKVNIKNIHPGNDDYKYIEPKIVNEYASRFSCKQHGDINLLNCLCKRRNENTFILVDGYHRYAAANNRGNKNMMVMWCDEQ